jgi:hypothetical protein
MSYAELIVEMEVEDQEIETSYQESQEFEVNHRSQEMLLVLNEVFDSILPSSKS